MLQVFAARSNKSKISLFSVRSSIIEPAMALAHKLHISVDDYRLEWTSLSKIKPERRTSLPSDFSSFECSDLCQNGRILRISGPTAPERLTYLLDLRPALVIRELKTELYAEPKILSRARVLVAATKEDERFSYPTPQPGKHTTMLGWMNDIVNVKRFPAISSLYA